MRFVMTFILRGNNSDNKFQPNNLPYSPGEWIVHLYGGNDTYVSRYGVSSTVYAGAGNDLIGTGTNENLVFGGAGNDTLSGVSSANSRFYGEAGNDLLIGGVWNTYLDGGAGADTMRGGAGDDHFIVDALGDRVEESTFDFYGDRTTSIDTVTSSVNWTLGANLENLFLAGAAASGTGNAANNRIEGNAGHNRLSGMAGQDTLIGNGGNDTLDGGAGVDTILFISGTAVSVNLANPGSQNTGWGVDRIANIENVTTGAGNDRINGSNLGNRLEGGAGNDLLVGIGGNDPLWGGSGEDQLIGGQGHDALWGQAGNDRLQGSEGNDTLSGGAGRDFFIFAKNSGQDVILDFTLGQDRIRILSGEDDLSDLRIRDSGPDALVNFAGGQITLRNVDHTALDADDFLFV